MARVVGRESAQFCGSVAARWRRLRWAWVAAALAGPVCAHAQARASWAPSTAFLQAGTVADTQVAAIGATWGWPTHWALGSGRLSAYGEASLAQWWYGDEGSRRDRSALAQVALVPVLRYRPSGGESPWFGEAGIGISFTTRLYDDGQKRFSTSFNFSDHLALGRNFGHANEHELALRVEHYSNGGIRKPNPGINFVALRYAYHFK